MCVTLKTFRGTFSLTLYRAGIIKVISSPSKCCTNMFVGFHTALWCLRKNFWKKFGWSHNRRPRAAVKVRLWVITGPTNRPHNASPDYRTNARPLLIVKSEFPGYNVHFDPFSFKTDETTHARGVSGSEKFNSLNVNYHTYCSLGNLSFSRL